MQRHRLIGVAATLDPLTDFMLIAWDTFRAAEFPFDEARRLALAVGGLDVDDLVRAKLISKKSGTVTLLSPAQRVRREGDDGLPGVRPARPASPSRDRRRPHGHACRRHRRAAGGQGVDRSRRVCARDSAFTACAAGARQRDPAHQGQGRVGAARGRHTRSSLHRLLARYRVARLTPWSSSTSSRGARRRGPGLSGLSANSRCATPTTPQDRRSTPSSSRCSRSISYDRVIRATFALRRSPPLRAESVASLANGGTDALIAVPELDPEDAAGY